jgi:hypothetical protein
MYRRMLKQLREERKKNNTMNESKREFVYFIKLNVLQIDKSIKTLNHSLVPYVY